MQARGSAGAACRRVRCARRPRSLAGRGGCVAVAAPAAAARASPSGSRASCRPHGRRCAAELAPASEPRPTQPSSLSTSTCGDRADATGCAAAEPVPEFTLDLADARRAASIRHRPSRRRSRCGSQRLWHAASMLSPSAPRAGCAHRASRLDEAYFTSFDLNIPSLRRGAAGRVPAPISEALSPGCRWPATLEPVDEIQRTAPVARPAGEPEAERLVIEPLSRPPARRSAHRVRGRGHRLPHRFGIAAGRDRVTRPALYPIEPAANDEPASEPDLDQVKVIGTLRIGIPLFNIYLNEADELSRRLGTELSEWALELHRPVGETAVALAHSLAGSSATVGFADLSATGTPARACAEALAVAAAAARRRCGAVRRGRRRDASPVAPVRCRLPQVATAGVARGADRLRTCRQRAAAVGGR